MDEGIRDISPGARLQRREQRMRGTGSVSYFCSCLSLASGQVKSLAFIMSKSPAAVTRRNFSLSWSTREHDSSVEDVLNFFF